MIHSHRLPRQPPTTHELPRRDNVGRVILDRSFLATNVFETEEEEEKEKEKEEEEKEEASARARRGAGVATDSRMRITRSLVRWRGRYYIALYAVTLIAS